jgi:hypothetical protein
MRAAPLGVLPTTGVVHHVTVQGLPHDDPEVEGGHRGATRPPGRPHAESGPVVSAPGPWTWVGGLASGRQRPAP